MTYKFEIDGRKVRVDWDGGRRAPAAITDDRGNRADFPAGITPFDALSKLGSPSSKDKLAAQKRILNCLDAASKMIW